MCGCYQFTVEQCAELLRIAKEIDARYGAGSWHPGEIRPAVQAPVLISAGGEIHPELQSWGYKLPNSLVINARTESAAEKPMFRDSVATRRCVVPSTGFYEWDREKHKYFFTLPGEDALYMAGLYSVREGKSCYCILTTQANESIKAFHHRMPLVLKKEQIVPWLEDSQSTYDILHASPPMLESVVADAQLRLW